MTRLPLQWTIKTKTETAMFYNLTLEVTYYHFCHILLITQTYTGTRWEGTTQACEFQKVGVTRTILEAGYHTRLSLLASVSTIWPEESPSIFMVKEGTFGTVKLKLSSDKVSLGSGDIHVEHKNQEMKGQTEEDRSAESWKIKSRFSSIVG